MLFEVEISFRVYFGVPSSISVRSETRIFEENVTEVCTFRCCIERKNKTKNDKQQTDESSYDIKEINNLRRAVKMYWLY